MRRFIYLVIAVSAIIGFGTSSASAQMINGCVSKNGSLKVVADPTDCSSRETGRTSARLPGSVGVVVTEARQVGTICCPSDGVEVDAWR